MPRLPQGPLTLEELGSKAETGEIDTVLTVFPDLYGRLLGKRIAVDFFLDEIAASGMHACDYLLTADMEMEVVEGYDFASWKKGYGDVHCVPDMATLRQIAWLDRSALVFCDLLGQDGGPVGLAPRTLLRTQIDRAAGLGYTAMCGTELEYYIFRETYRTARRKGFDNLDTFGWYLEDYHMLQGTKEEGLNGAVRRGMQASGISVETSKGEWGPGQHEINLRFAEAREMADRHVLYKQGIKEIALQQELAVSFMAKWRTDLAGSSMHLHLSLWDRQDHSAFPGTAEYGSARVSEAFLHFLGGWMAHARQISAFYAPYPNSYKRFVHQSWAPTGIAASIDNRTAAFRIVGRGNSLRIECRIPGADANPYLAIAASLAAGLDGVERRTTPPALFEGDVYEARHLPRVPASLREATEEMAGSDMLRAAFGDEVIEHYAHFFRTEQACADRAVTAWERERYFERA